MFQNLAIIYGEKVFEIFSPYFEKLNHKSSIVIKDNKFLLPHMLAGLIYGSYLWS